MKINFTLNGLYNNTINRNFSKKADTYALNYTSSPVTDTFEKNTNVSFKAGISKRDMLNNVLAGGGIAALAAIPVVSAIAFTKHQNPEEIFLSDGTYLGHVNDFKADDEAAHNAGIDLSNDRFTFKDPINGVFKNPEKGIDINFTQGKYIDPENGIFMDKSTGMSAVYNDGHFDPVAIPDVNFTGYYDPSAPVFIPKQYPLTIPREEFIKEHGMPPEEFYNNIRPDSPEIGFTPIDRRSVFEKVMDWFNDESPNKGDYWGREVIKVKDHAGNPHDVPLSDELSDIIHDRHMSYEDVQKFITYQAENPIEGYIRENAPQYLSDYNLINKPHMDDFLAEASSHHNDTSYADTVSHSDSGDNSSFEGNDGDGDSFDAGGFDGNGFDDFSGMI